MNLIPLRNFEWYKERQVLETSIDRVQSIQKTVENLLPIVICSHVTLKSHTFHPHGYIESDYAKSRGFAGYWMYGPETEDNPIKIVRIFK